MSATNVDRVRAGQTAYFRREPGKPDGGMRHAYGRRTAAGYALTNQVAIASRSSELSVALEHGPWPPAAAFAIAPVGIVSSLRLARPPTRAAWLHGGSRRCRRCRYIQRHGEPQRVGGLGMDITWRARPHLPEDLTFVSRRIVTDIVKKAEGLNPRLQTGGGLSVQVPTGWGVGASLAEHVPVDWSNIYELAARATHIVAPQTVTVDRTGPRFADLHQSYLRIKMPLQIHDIDVPGWEQANQHPVAAFAGYEHLPGVGRVFVGLVGSAHNHLPEGSIALGGRSGRTPSNAAGLYDIIEWARETHDPHVDGWLLRDDDSSMTDSLDSKLSMAANFFEGSALWAPSAVVEVLIKVHHLGERMDLGIDAPDGRMMPPFDKVVIGAPVWIGHVPLEDLEIDPGSGMRVYQRESLSVDTVALAHRRDALTYQAQGLSPELDRIYRSVTRPGVSAPGVSFSATLPLSRVPAEECSLFDSWLASCLAFTRGAKTSAHLDNWPPAGPALQAFRAWFVEQASRLGPDPISFVYPERRGLLRNEIVHEHNGYFGWVVGEPREVFERGHQRSKRRHIVLTDGRIVPSTLEGNYNGPSLGRWDAHPNLDALDASAGADVFGDMLLEVVQWRRPLYRRSQGSVLRLTGDGELQEWNERYGEPRRVR